MEEIKVSVETPKSQQYEWTSIGVVYAKDDCTCLLKFSPNNRFLLAVNKGITVFETLKWETIKFIDYAHDGEEIEHISFSLDGKELTSFSKSMEKTWDLKTWNCLSIKNISSSRAEALENLKSKNSKICFSSCGKFKAKSMGHYVIKLEMKTIPEKLLKHQKIRRFHRYSFNQY